MKNLFFFQKCLLFSYKFLIFLYFIINIKFFIWKEKKPRNLCCFHFLSSFLNFEVFVELPFNFILSLKIVLVKDVYSNMIL